MTINDIDFGQLYRDQMAQAGGREKPASAWDAKAAKMPITPVQSPYSQAFIDRTDLSGCETLLDMGCGTGTIALALAPRMKDVTGVDYSAGMLQAFQDNALARGLSNTRTIQRAWEDNWDDIPQCDLVVASRSTAVMDMADALQKLDRTARKRVCLTNLVGGSFIDPGMVRAMGRDVLPRPDYIFIMNILYQMGRYPRLDYIEARGRLAGTANIDEFLIKADSALGPLTATEKERLSDWYQADPERAQRGGEGFWWAFISWDTNQAPR
ncbi:methyltransferase [Streptosporangium jomthongense]|uniref:Methyltransferase domain-containing protein n=1 Tax=Marinobacter aromaticivorans TaxID=1494078 RepID=A0ABW2ISJ0_9GAMM|nr:class I SAM-dependent methyltransferase [Marinobacter aromaticivorans]GGE59243.1 methyltransferase [Streptosporangium jomthongense]